DRGVTLSRDYGRLADLHSRAKRSTVPAGDEVLTLTKPFESCMLRRLLVDGLAIKPYYLDLPGTETSLGHNFSRRLGVNCARFVVETSHLEQRNLVLECLEHTFRDFLRPAVALSGHEFWAGWVAILADTNLED